MPLSGWLWGASNPVSNVPMSEPIEAGPDTAMDDERLQSDDGASNRSNASRETSADMGDLVEGMNELAGKGDPSSTATQGLAKDARVQEEKPLRRRSPRKRQSDQEPEASPPSKKLRTHTQPVLTPRRMAVDTSRLKSSTRIPSAQKLRTGKNSFEIPDDEPDTDTARAQVDNPKLRRVRLLNKKPATAISSPLKGEGTVRTSLARNVNLQDSPSKGTRSRTQTTSALISPKVARAEKVGEPSRSLRDGVLMVRSGGARAAKNSSESAHATARPTKDTAKDGNIATPSTRPKSKARTMAEDGSEEGYEPKDGDSSAHSAAVSENGERADESDAAQPTVTAAERKKQDREAREEQRKQYRLVSLDGLEQIATLHDCTRLWRDLFAATKELDEMKNKTKPESANGRVVSKRLRELRLLYKKCASGNAHANGAVQDHNIQEIAEIGGRLWDYDTAKACGVPERTKKARDLYGHIVPGLCRTLKLFLLKWHAQKPFDLDTYEEIDALLKLAVEAADQACNWEPRPSTLDAGALSVMRNDVRSNLNELQRRFKSAYEGLTLRVDGKEQLNRLAEKQKSDQKELDEEYRERSKHLSRSSQQQHTIASQTTVLQGEPAILDESESDIEPVDEKKLLDNFEKVQKRSQASLLEAHYSRYASIINKKQRVPAKDAATATGVVAARAKEVVDIDDIDLGIPSPPSSVVSAPGVPTRPVPQRAQTEEIPGPVYPEWTKAETAIFTELLQKHKESSRFEEIFAQHGGPKGCLARHDVDSLENQATFIRQSMNNQLSKLGPGWNWLRSIPS